jgi:hypothetical protein
MILQRFRALLSFFFLLVFCSLVRGKAGAPAIHGSAQSEAEAVDIKNIRLMAWQVSNNQKRLIEVHELHESKPQYLSPSNKFKVECEIVGSGHQITGDYFVWTSIDFLVALLRAPMNRWTMTRSAQVWHGGRSR